jgi:tungstate transport system substrate-binding protein
VDTKSSAITRRTFLGRLGAGGATVGLFLTGCASPAAPAASATAAATAAASAATQRPAAAAGNPSVVRLSSVVIPQDSGLLAALLPDFEKASGYRVEVTTAQDVYGPARDGKFDMVLSHYQHEGVASFVQDGFGDWPRLAFTSPGALIGPPTDPAGIRGVTNAADALRKISQSGSPFIVNNIDGLRYVTDVLRRAAGLSADSWLVDKGTAGPDAIRAAVQSGGYTMWGLIPFLRMQQQGGKLPLEALVTRDQLLNSVMMTIIVREQKVSGVNTKGATALQQYLLQADTQAKVRTFRMATFTEPVWWPAAQDNEKAIMPK